MWSVLNRLTAWSFAKSNRSQPVVSSDMADSFYRQKSAECARMAQAATNSDIRARYLNEGKRWLEIADQVDANDKAERDRFVWPSPPIAASETSP
jgi:hypothetical protein